MELLGIIKEIEKSEKIENIDNYDQNILFITILKAKRHDLLFSNQIKLNNGNNDSSKLLIEFLLSDEDIVYNLKRNGFVFSKSNSEKISQIVMNDYISDNKKFEVFLAVYTRK